MKNLEEYEMQTLFESLGRVLRNQNKILMGLEQNKYKPHLNETSVLSNRCFGITQKYQNIIKETNETESNTEEDDNENEEPMTKQEIIEYLESTGLYNDIVDLLYVEDMLNDDKTIPIAELVERVVEIDKAFHNRPWNILQILTNINMIVPLEDRK